MMILRDKDRDSVAYLERVAFSREFRLIREVIIGVSSNPGK
ncbi:hypothetical protein PQR14_02680 [Paraburkholderia bryophila]